MYSMLCIAQDCNKYSHVGGSDTLVLYMCTKCTKRYPFVGRDDQRCMVAAKAIEKPPGLNLKQYKHITLYRYPDLDPHINSLMRRPLWTITKNGVLGNSR